jgi:antitoxin MazE
MKTRIVRIGNSQGIRIPKLLLEAAGLEGEVELATKPGEIIVRPARSAREGWAEAFRSMAKRGDDAILDGASPTPTTWDEEEWEW